MYRCLTLVAGITWPPLPNPTPIAQGEHRSVRCPPGREAVALFNIYGYINFMQGQLLRYAIH